MEHAARPYRSVLYIPGSKERALDKARSLPVDAIIFDLEDAVSVDEKSNARATLAAALKAGGYGDRAKIVRINGFDTDWAKDDVAALADAGADAFLLPKVNNALDIKRLTDLLPKDMPVWAMIETPRGIINAMEIAAHARIEGFVMGTNDLAKDLNCRFRADRLPLMTSLQTALLAARAHGVVCVDGVYNAFKDEDGLRAECEQGRDLGFDGKTLIHPAQVAVANEVFAPSEDEVALARKQIEAFEAAEAQGAGRRRRGRQDRRELACGDRAGHAGEGGGDCSIGDGAMIWLILGVALWWAAHLFKRVAPDMRASMGEAGKGVAAVALLVSVVLMVIGYRMADGAVFWGRSPAMVGINNLLMIAAFYCFGASAAKGAKVWLGTKLRHPQLTGFSIWAFAHLLVNGDVPSFILFGGLLAWALVEISVINKAEGPWTPPPQAPVKKEIVLGVVTVVLFSVTSAVHYWLGYPVFG